MKKWKEGKWSDIVSKRGKTKFSHIRIVGMADPLPEGAKRDKDGYWIINLKEKESKKEGSK